MFKIGEFSRLTQVSIRMLRHYDEVSLLKPAYIDQETGYRMYSINQIPRLQKIIKLRDLSFSIKEISELLENDEDYLAQRLNEKKLEIMEEIKGKQETILNIDKVMGELGSEEESINFKVSFKSIPSYKIISLREVIPCYEMEGMLWAKLNKYIEENNIEIVKRPDNNLAIYYDEGHKDSNVDIEAAIMVKKMGRGTDNFVFKKSEPLELAASMMVRGPYSNLAKAYESFANWLSSHEQYEMCGYTRQITHRSVCEENNPEYYLTEIQIPVRKIKS